MAGSGYMRAKVAQEKQIASGPIPFTIVQATQFFEFVPWIANASKGEDGKVRVAPFLFQPIAADDVAVAVDPSRGRGAGRRADRDRGPDRIRIDEAVRLAVPDADVVADPSVGYFGAAVDDTSLVAGDDAWIGERRFADFIAKA